MKMIGYVSEFKVKYFLQLFILFLILWSAKIFYLKNNPTDVQLIVWWTDSMIHNDRYINCYHNKYQCLLTKNRTDIIHAKAFLFYGSEINNYDFPLPRNNDVIWALFHEESPKNYGPLLYHEMQQLFNVTATFSRFSDFPVTFQYLKKLESITDMEYFVPVEEKNKLLRDISPVLYIQSDCDTPSDRDFLIKELSNYIKIDSYGTCLNNKTFPANFKNVDSLDLYNKNLLDLVSKYKFVIAIENSICDDYVTEKLWRSLIVGTVPIYLGAPQIKDWLPNNNSAILIKNFDSMELLAKYIDEINRNNTLYNYFLEHKLEKKISNNLLIEKFLLGEFGLFSDQDHPITAFECFVCKSIYDNKHFTINEKKSVYNCPRPNIGLGRRKFNTWDQHWDVSKCQAKAVITILDTNKNYSDSDFELYWRELYKNNNCSIFI